MNGSAEWWGVSGQRSSDAAGTRADPDFQPSDPGTDLADFGCERVSSPRMGVAADWHAAALGREAAASAGERLSPERVSHDPGKVSRDSVGKSRAAAAVSQDAGEVSRPGGESPFGPGKLTLEPGSEGFGSGESTLEPESDGCGSGESRLEPAAARSTVQDLARVYRDRTAGRAEEPRTGRFGYGLPGFSARQTRVVPN